MTPQGIKPFSLSARLVLCAFAIEFCVSANMLTLIGIPYVTEGGPFALKIHPGTYLLCLAFLAQCAAETRPNGIFWAALGRDKLISLYLGAIVLCLIYALLTTGKGNLIVLLDTFLPAGLLAATLQTMSKIEVRALSRLLQFGVAANAVLALCEASMHVNLVPLYLNDAQYHAPVADFRPTALYDHPLTGGVMTMIGLAVPPQRRSLRVPYVCLLMGAMLAFGGRVSVAAAVLSWLVMLCIDLGALTLRRDTRAGHLLGSLVAAVTIGTLFLTAALYAGLGARLVGHLYWDPSAQVRLAQWHLLGELTVSQLVLGTPRTDLLALLTPLWLDDGVEVIENFWLLMFVSLGGAGFTIFLIGFFSLLRWCWTQTGLRGRVLLVAVVLVVSTSNSLGRKSTLLVGLVAGISCVPAARMAHWRSGALLPRSRPASGVAIGAS